MFNIIIMKLTFTLIQQLQKILRMLNTIAKDFQATATLRDTLYNNSKKGAKI